jgi:type II secretory pathway component PulM
MKNWIADYWRGLQSREKLILSFGLVFVCVVFFYQFIWAPWHNAINYMEEALINHRKNLVWMRQQSTMLDESGGKITVERVRGAEESLMSVIEKTAGATGVREAIQQLSPRENNSQVSVVLEGVSFNNWLRWVDSLQSTYGVSVYELSAERESGKADIAEIRVTFERK